MEVDEDIEDRLAEPNAVGEGNSQLEDDPLGYNPQLSNTRYDPELRNDRRENKKKLKRRFEHIFKKYEQDFEGIGDEIDLKTGEIVVDNGHLQRMKNEHDVGNKTAVDPVDPSLQALEESGVARCSDPQGVNGLEHEDAANENGVSGDEETSFEDADDGDSSEAEDNEDSATSPFDADESAMEDEATAGRALLKPSKTSFARKRSMSAASSLSGSVPSSPGSQASPNGDILDQVPGLKDSMLNLQSKYKRGETVDPDAIQALGLSIANQLANFISRPGGDKSRRKSRRSKESSWSFPVLPEERTGKRSLRSRSPPLEDFEPPPSGKKSIWAPIRHPRQQKRRRMKDRELTQQPELDDDVSVYPPVPTDIPPLQSENRTQTNSLRVCTNCESSDSDVWRKGPNGDLCNTCGMYLYRYGLMRPIESAAEPITPEDTEGDVDPLERDWFLASAKLNSTTKKEIIKPVGVKNSHFVVEEDALIIQLKEIDLLSWERMATYFPGRSAYALQCRYSKKLHGRAPLARNILLEQGYRGTPDANGIMVFSYTREPFKDEEDELLLKLVDEDGLDFDTVAESLPGRSPEVLEIRYRELVKELLGSRAADPDSIARQRRGSREGSQPLARNARYSADEDAKIIKLREIDKLNWAQVAEKMEGRNSFSLQKRYIRELCGRHPNSIMAPRKAYSHLPLQFGTPGPDGEISDSSIDLESPKTAKYTAEEDAMLLDLRDAQGLTWEEIDPKMPGRSRSSMKSRHKYLRDRRSTSDYTNINGGEKDASLNVFVDDDSPTAASLQIPVTESGHDRASFGPRDMPELLVDGQSFTRDDDDLIRKLRDLESLPWSEIALQLPGKTVSSISERYYHFLLSGNGNAVQIATANQAPTIATLPVRATPQNGKPNLLKRWTAEEDTLLVKLREQGESWERVARQLPGRTAKAARIHFAAISDATAKSSRSEENVASTAIATSDALLLQRTNNGLQQEIGAATTANRPPGRMLLPKPTVSADIQAPQSSATRPQLQISPPNDQSHLPSNFNVSEGSKNITSPEVGMQSFPQTPFGQPVVVRHSSEPTPAASATAFYATPARFNPHGLPYFVNLPATYPLPSPGEALAAKAPPEKPPAVPQPNVVAQNANPRIFKRYARSKPQKKPRQSRANEPKQAAKSSDGPSGVRGKIAEHDVAGEASAHEDSSISETEQESWHESQNESESEADQSDSAESEVAQRRPSAHRAKMTVDPESADELPVDNSFINEIETEAVSRSPPSKLNDKNRSMVPSSAYGDRDAEEHRQQSEQEEIAVQSTSKREKSELFDMTYVNAHPEQTFRHRGNGKWVRDSTVATKPEKREYVDLDYVNAHPEEAFHHRGHGRWARGLPPADESGKFVISGPDHRRISSAAAKKERFSKDYVDAHPEETFHHRGRGQWARGLPEASEFGKFVVRGPGQHGKSSTQHKEELFDIEYVRAHPDDTFHHRGRGRWARGPPKESGEEQRYSQLNPEDAEDVSMLSLDSQAVDLPGTSPNGEKAVAGVDQDDSSALERPAVGNVQLAKMALQSKASEPMQLPEIYRFLEDKFEYFKQNTTYRAGIRATLSQQPQFQRAGAAYRAGWILADAWSAPRAGEASAVASEPVGDKNAKADPSAGERSFSEHQGNDSSFLEADSSELSITSHGALRSSPRNSTKKTSPLKSYEQTTTPGTGNSTLFSHLHQNQSADTSTPVKVGPAMVKRLGRISDLNNRRRTVETPVREFETSEDELA